MFLYTLCRNRICMMITNQPLAYLKKQCACVRVCTHYGSANKCTSLVGRFHRSMAPMDSGMFLSLSVCEDDLSMISAQCMHADSACLMVIRTVYAYSTYILSRVCFHVAPGPPDSGLFQEHAMWCGSDRRSGRHEHDGEIRYEVCVGGLHPSTTFLFLRVIHL